MEWGFAKDCSWYTHLEALQILQSSSLLMKLYKNVSRRPRMLIFFLKCTSRHFQSSQSHATMPDCNRSQVRTGGGFSCGTGVLDSPRGFIFTVRPMGRVVYWFSLEDPWFTFYALLWCVVKEILR
jgi:hypothetical protein